MSLSTIEYKLKKVNFLKKKKIVFNNAHPNTDNFCQIFFSDIDESVTYMFQKKFGKKSYFLNS